MLETNKNISEKTIWNAISAYLMMFISWLFLFNKENPEINNSFVKNHTKTAMVIHLWFLITYIIFISNWLFSWYNILGFWLNNIITDTIFILLLFLLANWIYKAKNKETFSIWESFQVNNKLLDIDWDWKITEKEKLTIILSFIPIIGFINFWNNKDNEIINNWTRINIVISLSITLLLIFWYINLATLLSLVYIIAITFISINLFTRDELITIKLPNSLSPKNLYITLKSFIFYIKNYFSQTDFKSFEIIKKEVIENELKTNNLNKKNLEKKKDFKLPKILIYIPFINLIFLFFRNSKYSFHIINWLIITLLTTKIIIMSYMWYININLIYLMLFPIFFWIWYLKTLEYKMPIIFDIYLVIIKIFSIFSFWSKKLKEKKQEEKEISLKPKNNN